MTIARKNKYTNNRISSSSRSRRNSEKIFYHKAELEYETNIVQMKSILLENIIQKLKTVASERDKKKSTSIEERERMGERGRYASMRNGNAKTRN